MRRLLADAIAVVVERDMRYDNAIRLHSGLGYRSPLAFERSGA